MIRHSIALALCLTIGTMFAAHGKADYAKPQSDGNEKVIGTWEHVLPENSPVRQIKIVNSTHFTWVTYDRRTGQILAAAGGTYSLEGNVYKELIQFGAGNLAKMVGQEQVFEAKFEGDNWQHSGKLSNGFQVRETWKRLEDDSSENKPTTEK